MMPTKKSLTLEKLHSANESEENLDEKIQKLSQLLLQIKAMQKDVGKVVTDIKQSQEDLDERIENVLIGKLDEDD